MSLLVGCATCKKEQVKSSGYKLVIIEQKIRVKCPDEYVTGPQKCPDEYITGPQWETTYVATLHKDWHNIIWHNYPGPIIRELK